MASFLLIRRDQPLGNADMLACWELEIPEGSNWGEVASQFATDNGFPVDAIGTIVDEAVPTVQSFILKQTWEPYSK